MTYFRRQRSTDYIADGTVESLCAQGTGNQRGGVALMDEMDGGIRQLMPIEEERLQGFPDGWTDIGEWVDSKGRSRQTTDGQRHTALGNSIAVGFANNRSGFWCWLMRRISAQYERQATLGSLFDGIGGFPLAWEACGGKAVWASEIEDFCIAVTKRHFPEKEDGPTEAEPPLEENAPKE